MNWVEMLYFFFTSDHNEEKKKYAYSTYTKQFIFGILALAKRNLYFCKCVLCRIVCFVKYSWQFKLEKYLTVKFTFSNRIALFIVKRSLFNVFFCPSHPYMLFSHPPSPLRPSICISFFKMHSKPYYHMTIQDTSYHTLSYCITE